MSLTKVTATSEAVGGSVEGKQSNIQPSNVESGAEPKIPEAPDFQEFLKRSGIKTAWVRAIVALYEEKDKPDDPLTYILKLMGAGIPHKAEVLKMYEKVKHWRGKLLKVQSENDHLRALIETEEHALQQRNRELMKIYEESKYFSEYNSEEDYDGDSCYHKPSYSSFY